MICEMINPLKSPVSKHSLFAAEGGDSVCPSEDFHQGAAAVTIVVRITVPLRSG